MRATLNLPDQLIESLMRCTDQKTKTQAIAVAMEEYIKKRKIEKLISLSGKIHVDLNWEKLEEEEIKAMKEDEKRNENQWRRRGHINLDKVL